MTTKRVADTKGLLILLAELFMVTEGQIAQALLQHHIVSWGDFKAHVALRAQAVEDAEEPK